jgi:hypothetical protein
MAFAALRGVLARNIAKWEMLVKEQCVKLNWRARYRFRSKRATSILRGSLRSHLRMRWSGSEYAMPASSASS